MVAVGPAADVGVGVVLVLLGALVWWRRPSSRSGLLVMTTGVAWLIGDFVEAAAYLHRGPLVHAVLAHPTGRLRSRRDMLVTGSAYVLAAVAPLSRDPWLSSLLAGAVVGSAAIDQVVATGPLRRAGRTATAAALVTAAALLLGPLAQHEGWPPSAGLELLYAGLVLIAVTLLVVDLLTSRWQAGVAAGLVIELGETSGSGVAERIGRAVGDPSLEIGYWVPASAAYVTDTGRRLPDTGESSPGRRVTLVPDGDAPLAAIEHDREALADRRLLDDVVAATRFAVSNAALDGQVRRQVEVVRSSRHRLLGAADEERRQVEVRLRQGPLRQLECARSRAAAAGLADDAAAITEVAERLVEVAAGIFPPGLAEGDLGPALRGLVRRAPFPVSVRTTARRLPADLAAAVYFLCAEAITNTAKHAEAKHVGIEVSTDDQDVAVRVSDDGHGGADQGLGSGLRGLADRCEALGGTFRVVSRPGAGTTVMARLPLDGGAGR